MSAYTTLNITRSKAIAFYIEQMLGGIPDRELERVLDIHLEPGLYNVRIVPDSWESNDDDSLR